MYIVFILQIYQVVRKAEFRLVLWCIQIWETELGKQKVPGNPVPRIEHFSRPDDGDKIKGALFLQRSVADAIKRLGPCPCSTVSGLVGNFLVHIMAGRGRVCWRSTASFPRCGKFLGIPSMSEEKERDWVKKNSKNNCLGQRPDSFFLKILSPPSLISGHNCKHDQWSCFILETYVADFRLLTRAFWSTFPK